MWKRLNVPCPWRNTQVGPFLSAVSLHLMILYFPALLGSCAGQPPIHPATILMVSSFWGHSPHSERTRWALTVSLLWAFRKFAIHTVSSLLPLHGELYRMILRIAHSKLLVWCRKLTEKSQQAHSVNQCVCSLWGNSVSSKRSSQWVSCELKFFTGLVTSMTPLLCSCKHNSGLS